MEKATKTALIIAGGAGLGVAIAGLLSSRSGSTPKSVQKVAMIGDSLGVGLGPILTKLFAPIPFQYEAVGGTTPAQWANHAVACGQCGDWLATFKPTVTLVVLGTNDMGGTPNASFYKTIRDGIVSTGSAVIWVEPPSTITKGSLAAVDTVIESLGVRVIPAANVQIGPDKVHPTGTGYNAWAQIIRSSV